MRKEIYRRGKCGTVFAAGHNVGFHRLTVYVLGLTDMHTRIFGRRMDEFNINFNTYPAVRCYFSNPNRGFAPHLPCRV